MVDNSLIISRIEYSTFLTIMVDGLGGRTKTFSSNFLFSNRDREEIFFLCGESGGARGYSYYSLWWSAGNSLPYGSPDSSTCAVAPLQDVPFLQWMDGNENEPFSAMDKVADQTMPRWQDHGGSTVEREREGGRAQHINRPNLFVLFSSSITVHKYCWCDTATIKQHDAIKFNHNLFEVDLLQTAGMNIGWRQTSAGSSIRKKEKEN